REEAPVSKQAAPAPAAPAPAQAPAIETAPARAVEKPKPKQEDPVAPAAEPSARVARAPGWSWAREFVVALARVGELISWPLRNQPRHVRDMVGWIALVNIFLAVCVWMYVMLI